MREVRAETVACFDKKRAQKGQGEYESIKRNAVHHFQAKKSEHKRLFRPVSHERLKLTTFEQRPLREVTAETLVLTYRGSSSAVLQVTLKKGSKWLSEPSLLLPGFTLMLVFKSHACKSTLLFFEVHPSYLSGGDLQASRWSSPGPSLY